MIFRIYQKKKYNLDRSLIRYYLNKNNIKIRPRKTQFVEDAYLHTIKELFLQGYNCKKIANILNKSSATISHHVRKIGLNKKMLKISNLDKFKKSKEISIANLQEQFILGSLLGDLSIQKIYNKTTNLRIVHCEKQKELFFKKVELLGDLMGSWKYCISKPDPRTGNIYYSYRGQTKSLEIFNYYRNLLYINNIKTISEDFLKLINHPIALAFWYMDDGDMRGVLSTNSFSENEVDLLISWLNNFWKIKANKQRWRNQFRIHILEESRLDFEWLIFPYIIPSMYYKLKYLDILQAESVNHINSEDGNVNSDPIEGATTKEMTLETSEDIV